MYGIGPVPAPDARSERNLAFESVLRTHVGETVVALTLPSATWC